ncbi:PTS system mannose/fructose/sorbose family transporter subunit IID [Lactobacillus sp. DCY120]|uniref:PTS system mannose/fructose/sorbose family transporter subunit IID n=1 Tax=Bombilactobacillus apium TaxID=2675299 RepID=A0A850R226_9LACO|nr:PTS system mannose/fructose/sorbose family transporter subunit IID [Bombilactobacillus apium]NVY96973.1 PTS system mannose/fructose/sorbose family transporter subunit IID [Bombilactobacillus apium]
MSEKDQNLMSKKDIKHLFWRMQTLSMSGNTERGGNLGYLYSMLPFLRKKYREASLEARKEAMQRHLEYVITHHVAFFLLIGTSMALEEKTADDDKEIVSNTKVSLMGPLAGLGDSILSYTWLAICGSIGATLATKGSILGPIVMFLMINALWFPLKWFGLKEGYERGVSLLSNSNSKTAIQRFSTAANAMGTVVVAALVVSNVHLQLGIKLKLAKGTTLNFQSMLDKILPNLLPILLTYACYWYLKKTNGKHVVSLIIGLLVLGTLLYMWGIIV